MPRVDRSRALGLTVAVLCLTAVVAAAVAQVRVHRAPTDWLDLAAAPFRPTPDRPLDADVARVLAAAEGDVGSMHDLLARLSPTARLEVDAEDMAAVAAAVASERPLRPFGVAHRSATELVLLAQGRTTTFTLSVLHGADGAIEGLLITPVPAPPTSPLADIEVILISAAGLAAVATGLGRRRLGGRGPDRSGTALVVAGIATLGALAELTPWRLTQDLAIGLAPLALLPALRAGAGRLPPALVALVTAAAAASLAPVLAVDFGAVPAPVGHLVTVHSLQGHVVDLQRLSAGVAASAALLVGGWLWRGPWRTVGPRHRARRWAVGGAAVGAGFLGGVGAAGVLRPPYLDLTASGWVPAAVLAVAAGHVAGLVHRQADLAAVSSRVADLGAARDEDLATIIARALDDRTARLVYPSAAGWIDRTGAPAELPRDQRGFTVLTSRGRTLGALLHDPGVHADPERLIATCDAVRLSLDNERLAAELRHQLEEVRASRRRLLQATDATRARLERDLHDGAQQRLTATLLALRVLQGHWTASAESAGAEPAVTVELAGALGRAADELSHAIEEIRELARGMRPAVLDGGLAAAMDAVAERAPIPVTVRNGVTVTGPDGGTGPDGWPIPAAVQTVVYFVVSEALTNAARHACAHHAEIELRLLHEDVTCPTLLVAVTDDGVGLSVDAVEASPAGPPPPATREDAERSWSVVVAAGQRPSLRRGSGLVGLFDRVDAHGGTLRVLSRPGQGTRVEVRLPCEPLS